MTSEEIFLEKKNFFIEMKNSLINYNSQIYSILNDNKNVMKEENNFFLNSLQKKINNNKYLISLIDDFLKDNCQHEIIEDYIEGGVEKDMIKIKYCKNCEITF